MNKSMHQLIYFLVGSSFILHPSSSLQADGGSVRLSEKKGGYRITVFSSPSPFRAGPVDISVLVQDAVTGQPLPQMQITLRMTPSDPSSGGIEERGEGVLEFPATQNAATNKLLYAAQFALPAPGRWQLEFRVEGLHGSAVVACELDAAESLPRWYSFWPWISWPVLVITLYSLHELLARRNCDKAVHLPALYRSGEK
jgi:hypothetical protein